MLLVGTVPQNLVSKVPSIDEDAGVQYLYIENAFSYPRVYSRVADHRSQGSSWLPVIL